MKRDDTLIFPALEIMKERLEFITHYLHGTSSSTDATVLKNRNDFYTAANNWKALGNCIKEIQDRIEPTHADNVVMIGALEHAMKSTLGQLRDFSESQLVSMKESLVTAERGRVHKVVTSATGVVKVEMKQYENDIENLKLIISKLETDIENIKKAERDLTRWAYHGTSINSITNNNIEPNDTERNLLGGTGSPD